MTVLWIWAAAAALYAAFSLWYNSLRGRLTPAEIDVYLGRLQSASGAPPEKLAPVRAFLEADDGREFFMLNLVRYHDGDVKDPGSGQLKPARQVLSGYSRFFLLALLRRAGHPAFGGRAAGRYVEHWGTEPDPGWSFAVVMRYRSRRDMIELASDPRFVPAHAYKLAAMASTLAVPVAPGYVCVGPRVTIALAVALIAALVQLALGVPDAGVR